MSTPQSNSHPAATSLVLHPLPEKAGIDLFGMRPEAGSFDFTYRLLRLYRRSVLALLLFRFGFDEMPNSHDGVVKDHPRTGEAHDTSDFFSHVRLVTVDFAARAEGLCLHKLTLVDALFCVGIQCGAFGAKRFSAVLFSAVKSDHQADDFLFPSPFAVYVRLQFSHRNGAPAAGY